VNYEEFESNTRQLFQYLMIQDGALVPGNSPLFNEVNKDFKIVPIAIDSGVSAPTEAFNEEGDERTSTSLPTNEAVDTESTYPVIGHISSIRDIGLGGSADCPALIVTETVPHFSDRLTTINNQHYVRNFGQDFIQQEIGTDQFLLFGRNWKRDLSEEQREVIYNSNSNEPVIFRVSELADPGPRGYDVCDLHEIIKLELVDV